MCDSVWGPQPSLGVKSSPVSEYPEDDVTASAEGQTAVQSQAQFPQRPVKHQNSLLSSSTCVQGGFTWHWATEDIRPQQDSNCCFLERVNDLKVGRAVYVLFYLLLPAGAPLSLSVSTPHQSNHVGSGCCNIPVGLEQRVPMQLVFHAALIAVIYLRLFAAQAATSNS